MQERQIIIPAVTAVRTYKLAKPNKN